MITKEDTAALRKADTIVFHHDPKAQRNGSDGRIRALKKFKLKSGPFETEETAEFEIPVDSYIKDYGKDDIHYDQLSGAVVLSYCQWNDSIGSAIARTIKVGDMIELEWLRNNATPSQEEAGLVADELRIHIRRGKTRFVYIVAHQVGKDNSARMIRYPY